MPTFIDLTGQQFGRLVALRQAAKRQYWVCRCDCGNERIVFGPDLQRKRDTRRRRSPTQSCGCLFRELARKRFVTHGHKRGGKLTRVYTAWCNMLQRCLNPKVKNFSDYGGRGIQVCERWLKFENFFADMGECPPGMSIDRRDNNGNYEPDNAQWATRQMQNRNQRRIRPITFNGETLLVTEWAERLGLNRRTLVDRLNKGWPIERALTAQRRGKEI